MATDTQTSNSSPSTKPTAVVGLNKPFEGKDLEKEGIDAETGLFHGVDPEKGEHVSVTLAGLQAQFGKKEGEAKYLKIAGLAGGSVFFNPATEATSYRPPLGISNLKKEHLDAVNAILTAKE